MCLDFVLKMFNYILEYYQAKYSVLWLRTLIYFSDYIVDTTVEFLWFRGENYFRIHPLYCINIIKGVLQKPKQW